jgi:uncharacterized protein (TIGR02453 family)
VNELIFRIQEFDKDLNIESKDAIFRINRDMRFSKDKSPCKTWISANMNHKAKRTLPNSVGYYVHIDPDFVQIGGGSYHIDKHGTYAVRSAIVDHGEEFNEIITEKNFKKLFVNPENEEMVKGLLIYRDYLERIFSYLYG